MSEFMQAINLILSNPETAWLGYAMIILVLVSLALTLVSGFMVKVVANIKQIAESIKKHPRDYKKQIKTEADVSAVLRTIRHDLHADRVCILQYHNGVNSIADNSLLKISMSHESLSVNVNSIANDMQNWFANSLGSINNDIFDGRYVEHTNIENMADDPELRQVHQYMKQNHVKSVYCFPVVDVYGKTFGIGVVQYIRRAHTLDSEWTRWARDRFVAVGALLAGTDKDV